jgi:hypothetical protein
MSELRDASDQWFLTTGVVAVGPIDFERLTHGVRQGSIPASAFVRHQSWRVWRTLQEIEGLTAADRRETVTRLAGMNAVAEERAADPHSQPPPPISGELFEGHEASSPPLSSVRPRSVDPVGVLAAARGYEEALLLTLNTAVTAANADAGFLHRARRELSAVVTTYAQGPSTETLLGSRIPFDDPALIAARTGRTILGEPQLGEAGRYIAGRFSPCLGVVRGVALVPVLVFGDLLAFVVLGRCVSPFRACEFARVDDVVEALTARAVVEGWI